MEGKEPGCIPLSCVISVLTYLRPDDLAALLPELIAQASRSDEKIVIRVIDNDPLGSATSSVATYPDLRVEYAHEPTPGIAAARNRALSLASGADLLIFIDDDERPCTDWLQGLLSLYRERRPAAVAGRVVSKLSPDLDPWIVAGQFFDRRSLRTGSQITVAATNNLLLDLAVVRKLGLTFDDTFGISGGSDTLFTRRLSASGAVLLWHEEAVVVDVVPPSRQTRAWVLQRAFRSGNSWSQTAIAMETSVWRRWGLRGQLTSAGLLRLAGGAVFAASGFLFGSLHRRARGRRILNRGLGMISGAWGHRYLEYRRPVE